MPPEKIESLPDDVKPLVLDLLARVADAGYHQVTAEYSLSRVADRFLDDFQLLLQNSHG